MPMPRSRMVPGRSGRAPTPVSSIRRRVAEGAVEAGAVTGVTGPRPLLVDLDQQGVTVAVVVDAAHVLAVARGLALAPVLLSATAPEPGPSGVERAAEGLAVHPGEHEDGTVGGILDDGPDQTVPVEGDPIELGVGKGDRGGRVGGGVVRAGAHERCSLVRVVAVVWIVVQVVVRVLGQGGSSERSGAEGPRGGYRPMRRVRFPAGGVMLRQRGGARGRCG